MEKPPVGAGTFCLSPMLTFYIPPCRKCFPAWRNVKYQHGHELHMHMDIFRLQKPVLLLDLSTLQRLCCTWTCQQNRVWSAPGRVWTTRAINGVALEINSVKKKSWHSAKKFPICDKEFRGILGNFTQNTGDAEVQKHTEYCFDGIPWTPYYRVHMNY